MGAITTMAGRSYSDYLARLVSVCRGAYAAYVNMDKRAKEIDLDRLTRTVKAKLATEKRLRRYLFSSEQLDGLASNVVDAILRHRGKQIVPAWVNLTIRPEDDEGGRRGRSGRGELQGADVIN